VEKRKILHTVAKKSVVVLKSVQALKKCITRPEISANAVGNPSI
jgi:hypothetical protein